MPTNKPKRPKASRSSRSSKGSASRPLISSNRQFLSLAALAFVAVFALIGVRVYQTSHAAGTPEIRSSLSGNWCINDEGADTSPGNRVDTATCNGYAGEDWWWNAPNLKFTGQHCLQPENGYVGAGTKMVIQPCNGKQEQNWTSKNGVYTNAKSGLCLTSPDGNVGVVLTEQQCSGNTNQNWILDTYTAPTCSSGYEASVGTAQCIAHQILGNYGWNNSTQYSCLNNIYVRESGWRWDADNVSSGAYGIPQSLPASKMASYGSDYLTNATTQLKWGINYISSRYGTPCDAWAWWQAHGWYITSGGVNQ